MSTRKDNLITLIQEIVQKAKELKDTHTDEKNAPVNYACVFAQSQEECESLLAAAKELGLVVEETKTGPLFRIEPLETSAGKLQLLKIRQSDPARPELGDADFTVADYPAFKEKYLRQAGFKLIERERFEMIELADSKFNVLTYFSHPPLNQQLNID